MPEVVMVKIVAAFLVATSAISAWATACFDDANLQTLDFQAHRGVLLYVWSPRMALSMQHAASAQRQAQLHGLRFLPVHDAKVPQAELDGARQSLLRPSVSSDLSGAKDGAIAATALSMPPRPQEAHSAEALAGSQPLCAASVLERDALRHFPTAFVLQASGIHRYPIVGAMPEAAWAHSIAQRLGTAVAQNTVNAPGSESEQCIPANTFAELPAVLAGQQTDAYGKTTVALGSYERISPDGRYVLRSFSGGRLGDVSLVELSSAGKVVAAHDTPLSNEAFPVQGTWRYVVDVNGDHYTFSSLLRNTGKDKQRLQAAVKPVFRGGMTGFYAAAAELPQDAAPSQPGHVRIRSMSWPNATGDSETQGQGALVARTIEVDTARQRITADSGFVNLCNERVREDGPMYALPMISVDGLEFAALPQTPVQGEPTMRIFSFGDAKDSASVGAAASAGAPKTLGCIPQAAFTFSSGKTIFGHPQSAPGGASDPGDMAYEYRSQVWWVHRGAGIGADAQGKGNGQRFNVAPYYDSPRTQLVASAFPGITKDGRIIYGATLKDCPADPSQPCVDKAGYVISDPFQSNAYQAFLRQHKGPARRQCITHGDVERERAAFATLHGLSR